MTISQQQRNERDLANLLADRRVAIDQLIAQVQAGVDKTVDDHKAQPANWGYAGNLGHVVEQLDEIARFLGQGGTDAVVLPKHKGRK